MRDFILQKLLPQTAEEREMIKNGGVNISDYTRRKSKRISGIGYFENDKPLYPKRHPRFFAFPEHGHDYCEIMLAVSGEITHVIDGEKVTLRRGDLIVLSKATRHCIEKTQDEDIGLNYLLSDRVLLDFIDKTSSDVLKSFFTDCFKKNGTSDYVVMSSSGNIIAENLVENVVCLTIGNKKNAYRAITDTLFLLFDELGQSNENIRRKESEVGNFSQGSERKDDYAKKIRRYIAESYVNGSLCACAEQLGINPQYLSRLTKKITGKNFKTLLIEQKLNQAERLLSTTDLTVQEISSAVGYENVYGFNQAFIKRNEQTPSSWRKTTSDNCGMRR